MFPTRFLPIAISLALSGSGAAVCVSPNLMAPDGSPCVATIQAAIYSPDTAIIVYSGVYNETGLVLGPGRSLTGWPGAVSPPVIHGSPGTITLQATCPTTVRNLELQSGRPNGTALKIVQTCSNQQVNLHNLTILAQGSDSEGIELSGPAVPLEVSCPPPPSPNSFVSTAGAYLHNLRISSKFVTSTTRGFVIDTPSEFELSDPIITVIGNGVGIDLIRAPGYVSNFWSGAIHVKDGAIGLRRAASGSMRLSGVAFVSDDAPGGQACSSGGRCFIKETGGNSALSLVASGLNDDSCRNVFTHAPKIDGSHWRGSCVPFPCPQQACGTQDAEVCGAHWFDTGTGQDKICTAQGWKVVTTQ